MKDSSLVQLRGRVARLIRGAVHPSPEERGALWTSAGQQGWGLRPYCKADRLIDKAVRWGAAHPATEALARSVESGACKLGMGSRERALQQAKAALDRHVRSWDGRPSSRAAHDMEFARLEDRVIALMA